MKISQLKIKYFFYLFLLITISLLISAGLKKRGFFKKELPATKETKEKELTKVKLAMGYVPNIQFAPFYVALDKGYFADQGLEIDFDYGWETDIIQLTAKNELQFGIASGDQVILAASQDLPIVYLFNWYQKFPVTITSLAETKITQPADLVGKKIGLPALHGASYIGLKAFLSENNISEKKVDLQTIGYTQVPNLTEKKVEAAVCYAMNEPVQLENSGYSINNIYVHQFANLVSNGLITNQETIEKNPQLIQSLITAFSQGLEETIKNPDQAWAISKKFIPELKEEDEPLQKKILQQSIEYWRSAVSSYGLNNKDQWQKSVGLMKQFGLIEKEPLVDNLFTNQFIK